MMILNCYIPKRCCTQVSNPICNHIAVLSHFHWIHMLRLSGFHGASLCLAVCWDEDFEENRWERLAVVFFLSLFESAYNQHVSDLYQARGFSFVDWFSEFPFFQRYPWAFLPTYQAYQILNNYVTPCVFTYSFWSLSFVVLCFLLVNSAHWWGPWIAWSWFQAFFVQDSLTNPPPWRAPYQSRICLSNHQAQGEFLCLWFRWCQKHVQTGW